MTRSWRRTPLSIQLLTGDCARRIAKVLDGLPAVRSTSWWHARTPHRRRAIPCAGVIVIDEQHRFGVEQRARCATRTPTLRRSGRPGLLVMTATPIPRTAQCRVRRPGPLGPGRDAAGDFRFRRTGRRTLESRAVAAGTRRVVLGAAYVICPLVEDSEKWRRDASKNALA